MKYNNIRYWKVNGATNKLHYLIIDGIEYIWEIGDKWCSLCKRDDWPFHRSLTKLNITLNINVLNPKETIDQYFKLLLLQ
jgi:hypothetical protein